MRPILTTRSVLRLLARLTPPLESARGLFSGEAARRTTEPMEEPVRDAVTMRAKFRSRYGPREVNGRNLICCASPNTSFLISPRGVFRGPLPLRRTADVHRLKRCDGRCRGLFWPACLATSSSLAGTWERTSIAKAHRSSLAELSPAKNQAVLRGPISGAFRFGSSPHARPARHAGRRCSSPRSRNTFLNYARRNPTSDPSQTFSAPLD